MDLITERWAAKLALTIALLALAAALYATKGHGPPAYYMVDDLVANGLSSHRGQELRVHGVVQPGSIERPPGDDVHRFMVVRGGVGVRVIFHGPLPDTFRDQAEVIVTGRLLYDGGWEIDGSVVIAKCPTKYEGRSSRLDTAFRPSAADWR